MFSCMILEQKLEETLEELQRVTEAESSLKNRCSCLEEKQKMMEEQTEVAPSVIILTSNIQGNGTSSSTFVY